MLLEGFTPQEIRPALPPRPLLQLLRTTAGAVVRGAAGSAGDRVRGRRRPVPAQQRSDAHDEQPGGRPGPPARGPGLTFGGAAASGSGRSGTG
ncbi:Hypothetical Protein sle_02280 [Streptomyces leeuwenhoekii]|uniref:Uncharacterized protein n=2 Tax=Streptomyces leeuwenhoekii TaxID=1437453 RepID=A0A0F7VLK7_STRLW|nr:Hypothetical Protein sle_02280 [Streptomyces leeuwenhoekii]